MGYRKKMSDINERDQTGAWKLRVDYEMVAFQDIDVVDIPVRGTDLKTGAGKP